MNMPTHSLRTWLCCAAVAAPLLALAASPAPRTTYQVVSGDTLDKVIKKTMPDSAVLNVPKHDDLLRSYMVPGNAPGNSGTLRGGGYSTADMNMNERKNWVRFP